MSAPPIDMRPDHEVLVREILLARLPKGVRVWVFGSRATWRAKQYSDLDLALEGAEPLPDSLVNDLADEFRESDLPWKVDVLDFNAITPSFRKLIDKDRVGFLLGRKVMGEWANHRLADVIELIGGGTPKRSRPDYWGGDIPWLSVKDINDDKRYVCSVEETITEDGLNNSSTKILKPGQIIISARGTVGALAQIAHPMAFNQSCYGINANTKFTTNDYVYYLLQDIVPNLQNIAHGAVFDTITRDTFQLVDIKLPPLPEQRTIAAILGSLDDKIDLNRRMNETLETMARAIFKDWFVDFGPTRAKMEGRKPYLAPEIWELFPEKLGEDGVPVGWEMGTLVDCVHKIQNGGTPKRSDDVYWEGGKVPWLTSGEVRKDIVIETQNFITEVGLQCSSAKMLPAMIPLVALYGATAGQVTLSAIPLSTNQAISAVIPQDEYRYYALIHLKREVEKLANSAVGSAQQNISKKIVEELSTLVPGENCAIAFEDCVAPLFERAVRNLEESRTLAQTRDLLLPKLMSGQIRVREAEKLVEEVV